MRSRTRRNTGLTTSRAGATTPGLRAVARASTLAGQSRLDGRPQLVCREGLQEDGTEAEFFGTARDLRRAVRRDQHEGHLGAHGLRLLVDLEAVHARHAVVDDQEVEGLATEVLERGLPAVGALDRVAERLEDVHAEDDDGPGVVHDQDLELALPHALSSPRSVSWPGRRACRPRPRVPGSRPLAPRPGPRGRRNSD